MAQTLIKNENIARQCLYRFLQLTNTYPNNTLLEVLQSSELWDSLECAVETLDIEGQEIIRGLSTWIKSYQDNKKLLLDLQIEYTYLFINAIPHVPASPYESAYTDRRLLMGEPVSKVIQAYRKAGLNIRLDYDNLPDHIATEIEFMFFLVRQESIQQNSTEKSATNTWKEQQKHFMEKHLAIWGPLFLSKVEEHTRILFYRLVAKLCDIFFQSEIIRVSLN